MKVVSEGHQAPRCLVETVSCAQHNYIMRHSVPTNSNMNRNVAVDFFKFQCSISQVLQPGKTACTDACEQTTDTRI